MRENDTVQLLVLAVLADGAAHGYEVAREIERRSGAKALAPEGRLYPVLHGLEKEGFVTSHWSEEERRRRVYQITETGKGRLARAKRNWVDKTQAIMKVIEGGAS